MKAFSLVTVLLVAFFLVSFGYSASVAAQGLSVGDSGKEVAVLQTKLLEYGFYDGSVDGAFGLSTTRAVIAFQLVSGLEADGIVGYATLDKLRDYRGQAVSRGGSERKGQQVVDYAIRYLGTPYVWGGSNPGGFDCSGFITYIFHSQNVYLPRMADEQFEVGLFVPVAHLQPGDLLFFTTYEPGPSHIGIYVGEGQFIHASSGANQVTITALSNPYYSSRYLGAKRVI